MGDSGCGNKECGICLGEFNNPVKLPCGHSFCADCLSGWKPKYTEDTRRRRCPLCRGAIPPSQEQVAKMKRAKELMVDESNPLRKHFALMVEQFEAEYGEDWDGTKIEYGNGFVDIPMYIGQALNHGYIHYVLQWLNKGNIKGRVNAKAEIYANLSLLFVAAKVYQYDLMKYLLLKGADVNSFNSFGASVLTMVSAMDGGHYLEAVRLLLSWGAELFLGGEPMSEEGKLSFVGGLSKDDRVEIAELVSSELGGRRCEIVSSPNTHGGSLVGKTCVVEEYLEESNQCKVTMEFTNEVLLIGADNIKRRDRTPQDPGYYIECKNNRLIRRDFKSNEECRAFITTLGADEGELAVVDPDAEAKAEQAAADLLTELGLDDLDEPRIEESKTKKPPSGKKKKRVGKKKGRK